VGFVVIVLALLALALADQWGTLRHEARDLSLQVLVLSFVFGLAALGCTLMVWRSALADLGSHLSIGDACRIMFVGQLGKYVPGSVWPVLGQMELGAQRGVPRGRSAVSLVVTAAVMVCTGGLVAAVTLAIAAPSSSVRYIWVLLAVPVGVILLSPPVLNRFLRLTLRILRRPGIEEGVSLEGLTLAACWGVLCWVLYGAMTYVLMARLAGNSLDVALVSIGGFALSWVAGYLAVFAPAGAGVREAVMVAVLSTQTKTSVALVVALVTRALSVVADAVAGALGASLIGRRQLRELRSRRSSDAPPPVP
jgi:uncharacterized membrane protein YbhN (UPF0104 family)